jgi:hypothetical protein
MELDYIVKNCSCHHLSCKRVFERHKMGILVNLSTITKIILKPSDLGKPSIKSIDKSFQAPSRIGNG